MSPVLWFPLLCVIALHHLGRKSSVNGDRHQRQYDEENQFLNSEEIDPIEFLRGSYFRIYAANYPPMMSIIKNPQTGLTVYNGMLVDFYNYFAQHYDLKVIYVSENASEVAKYGQIQAAINVLINKEVDLSSFGLSPTPERLKLFDMTSAAIADSFQLMVMWPEEEEHWTVVARPFDGITWLLIAISFLALLGMLSALALLVRYKRGNPPSFKTVLDTLNAKGMYIIGITTNHGQSIPYNSRLSLRIVLGFWLLMMIVLINAYTGVLTSLLTVPKLKPIPQSLEELAAMKDYRVTINKNHLLAIAFLNASSGPYKVLGDTLRENPKLLYTEYQQATENVLKHHAASVEFSIGTSFRIASDYKANNGTCRMTASNMLTHTQGFASALPKSSPYTEIVEREMWRAVETGLIDYWKKKNVPSMDRCKLNGQQQQSTDNNGKPKTIKFIHLSCAFFVLAVGLGLSILAFLLEPSAHKKLISHVLYVVFLLGCWRHVEGW